MSVPVVQRTTVPLGRQVCRRVDAVPIEAVHMPRTHTQYFIQRRYNRKATSFYSPCSPHLVLFLSFIFSLLTSSSFRISLLIFHPNYFLLFALSCLSSIFNFPSSFSFSFSFIFSFSSSLLQFPLLHFLLFIPILFLLYIVFFPLLPPPSYMLFPSYLFYFYFHLTFSFFSFSSSFSSPSSPFFYFLASFSFFSSSLSFFFSSSFILSLFFFFLS